MGGRHRSGKGSRRAGWFVACAFVGVVALGASLTAVVVNNEPPKTGPGTDPEAGVSLRTYPVPQPTASPSDVARNLRAADTAPPATRTSRATHSQPAVSPTPQPSASDPDRRRRARPQPTRVCYVFRYRGHTYHYCATHTPHR